jgi:hypothetical protein
MAVLLQFFNIIIPIEKINKCKGIGGLEGFLEKYKHAVGNVIWYDKYLLRDGAMGMDDVDDIIMFWKKQGLKPKEIRNGKAYWKDLCVVDSIDGFSLPCDWLVLIRPKNKRAYVYLRGKPVGKVIGVK